MRPQVVTLSDTHTATVHMMRGAGAIYDFGALGKVHAQSAYFGQPDRADVTISLGSPGDKSGYGLTGLHVGDCHLTGIAMCTGDGMSAQAHPHYPDRFPLPDIHDADTRADSGDLLSGIAQHYYDVVSFTG